MSFAELVLVVGDFHIPHRAADIHEQFRKILGPNKIQHVLCTGNLNTKEQVDFLRSIAPRVHLVRGDFDEEAEGVYDTKVVTIGDFRIGMIHGHQVAPLGETEALAVVQRRLDVDVLVSGHTHQNSIIEYEGKCFINPGSITGAYTPLRDAGDISPSFVLMNIKDKSIDFFTYEIPPGEKIKISRATFAKPA